MFLNNRVLGIIPARGGSKGLPKKNILDTNGKPLISWTIQQAEKSTYIDRIIVSTDDEEIAERVGKNIYLPDMCIKRWTEIQEKDYMHLPLLLPTYIGGRYLHRI